MTKATTSITQNLNPSHQDAELIALCDEFDEVEHRITALYNGPNASEDEDQCDALSNVCFAEQQEILTRMRPVRAKTMDGLLARVRTMFYEHKELGSETFLMLDSQYINEQLMGGLLRDLAELAGVWNESEPPALVEDTPVGFGT